MEFLPKSSNKYQVSINWYQGSLMLELWVLHMKMISIFDGKETYRWLITVDKYCETIGVPVAIALRGVLSNGGFRGRRAAQTQHGGFWEGIAQGVLARIWSGYTRLGSRWINRKWIGIGTLDTSRWEPRASSMERRNWQRKETRIRGTRNSEWGNLTIATHHPSVSRTRNQKRRWTCKDGECEPLWWRKNQ